MNNKFKAMLGHLAKLSDLKKSYDSCYERYKSEISKKLGMYLLISVPTFIIFVSFLSSHYSWSFFATLFYCLIQVIVTSSLYVAIKYTDLLDEFLDNLQYHEKLKDILQFSQEQLESLNESLIYMKDNQLISEEKMRQIANKLKKTDNSLKNHLDEELNFLQEKLKLALITSEESRELEINNEYKRYL